MTHPSHDRLEGRAALVTGASRGLGLLIARELGRRGCKVLICARDGEELCRAERMLRAEGAEVRALACDVTGPSAARRLVDATTAAFGGVDILVNNAGNIQVGPVSAMTETDFRDAMETMYFAPLRLVLTALPEMRERGGGRIVTIASLGGRVAAPHLLPYAGAKFALTGLSQGLRAELAADGISVTTVLPGLMRTGSHTAARFSGQPTREYAWFAVSSGLPLLSMDAERAARAIVRAAERRRPELVLTPIAKAAVRLHGMAPATTTRALTLGARLLPRGGPGPAHDVPGRQAARRLGSAAVARLTVLNDRAARRYNQRTGP
ncbi:MULTISPECIES: SDR family NAD(P)-dependent oxidoreductase [Streptomyces]|uniref:SDR family NAD(P)-dependent oxidoreductase n=1 Tax=Streptomyces TaxID=1883 RepID=UPI00163C140D|nr:MULTISPECIES: SDR family NAD(P)-dependent oxidoreductase [Streptomyces]MBC2879023.1 SDR family NAD(P)-dependent oxidoreductase [Streptomyces sp. TYQ1024]UBI40630.1 SDR family NAD(P)-dependent oxidoreductase [Streptomyces mobaraensis]UKW33212.1 SDR family NAD(P)-dependent oxidoreductase [Streptomyces sp. TYQ1024]